MEQARLGDYTFLVDPTSVQWNFRMRMNQKHTVGGRVIQVFGTDLGDMVVRGTLGIGDRGAGDTQPWEAMERFVDKMEDMADASGLNPQQDPLKFTLPAKNWAFDVYIKDLAPVNYTVQGTSPEFTLTLFIVEDLTGRITRGVVDKYIERLVKGIGWSQSEYNGPTEEEVEDLLAPYQGSPGLAYKSAMIEAFTSAMAAAGFTGVFSGGAVGGGEDLGRFLWALREQESGHDYTVVNPIGAAGAYQYMPGTWANYKGYSSAHLAPPPVQDEKAAADAMKHYTTYQDWGLVAAIWYSGRPIGPDDPEWSASQGGYPSIGSYVTSILSKMQIAPT